MDAHQHSGALEHLPLDLLPDWFHPVDAHVQGLGERELAGRNIIEDGITADGVVVAVALLDGRRNTVVSSSPGLNLLLPVAIGHFPFPVTCQISVVPFA